MRYKMVFAYFGLNYYGYQIQDNQVTIQGEIEKYLKQILQEDIRIYASGRTDRGVHALNQVAIFDIDKEIDCSKLRNSLNKLLSKDIHIKSLCHVEDSFHARFSAIKKEYIYKMALKENEPLLNLGIYYSNKNYDLSLLDEVLKLFLGKHDFKNFCTNKEENTYIEEIYSFKYEFKNNYLTFFIVGSGFKRYMVRMIIGTILEALLHHINVQDIIKLLDSQERNIVSYKVPPQGLYLSKVYYKEDL